MRRALIVALLCCASVLSAKACNAIADGPGSSCAQWANITGDVEQDRCPIARADESRARAALEQLRASQEPGDPAWSRAFVIALINEARGRVSMYCGNSAASLP